MYYYVNAWNPQYEAVFFSRVSHITILLSVQHLYIFQWKTISSEQTRQTSVFHILAEQNFASVYYTHIRKSECLQNIGFQMSVYVYFKYNT